MTLEIDVLTLFPAMIAGPLAESIPGRIQERGLADDPGPRPARVGPRPAPVGRRHAVRRRRGDGHARRAGRGRARRRPPRRTRRVILLDPGGEVFRQARAADLADRDRTSSSSARATRASTSGSASLVDLELSIGDYVLTGGELPALVVIDAVIRLLPGRHRRRVDGRGVVQRTACSSTRSTRGRRRSAGMDVPADPDLRRPRRGRAAGGTSRPLGRGRRRPPTRTCCRRTSGSSRPSAPSRGRGARAILRRRSRPSAPLPNVHPAASAAHDDQGTAA